MWPNQAREIAPSDTGVYRVSLLRWEPHISTWMIICTHIYVYVYTYVYIIGIGVYIYIYIYICAEGCDNPANSTAQQKPCVLPFWPFLQFVSNLKQPRVQGEGTQDLVSSSLKGALARRAHKGLFASIIWDLLGISAPSLAGALSGYRSTCMQHLGLCPPWTDFVSPLTDNPSTTTHSPFGICYGFPVRD